MLSRGAAGRPRSRRDSQRSHELSGTFALPEQLQSLQKCGNWRVFQIMAPMLHDWDNFYVTTGAASASLIGLLFVVVTLGADFSSSDATRGPF
jgi:hypothetical protein